MDADSQRRGFNWVCRAVRASVLDANPRPLIELLKFLPSAIKVPVVHEEVRRWWSNTRVRNAALGTGPGRPPSSTLNAHLLFYVARAVEKGFAPNEEQALHWLVAHPELVPFRHPFESLKRIHKRAKKDPRLQAVMFWDIPRAQLFVEADARKLNELMLRKEEVKTNGPEK